MSSQNARLWYKLTDQNGCTFNGTQWGDGVTHAATGEGREFCTKDLVHFYSHPLVALLHNPIHADFKQPLLWATKVDGRVYSDRGLKHGAKRVTTLYTISTPALSPYMRVHYAILCTKQVFKDANWLEWADNWLNGSDRGARAAAAHTTTAYAVTHATSAAAYAAIHAAYAAIHAAYAAARAAATADASTNAAYAAAYATSAANTAAVGYAAAYAACAAASTNKTIAFPRLAEQAMVAEGAEQY